MKGGARRIAHASPQHVKRNEGLLPVEPVQPHTRTMRVTLKRSLASIDERWPAVKYCSLGFYSAWILLTMRAGFVGSVLDGMDGDASNWLYLYSGVPLTVILLLCGIFSRRVEPYIARGPLVPAMALLAGVCTFLIAATPHLDWGLFVAASIGTGIGTPFLCLRIGHMYSTLDSNRVLFATFASGILANLLYFVCCSIDALAASVLLACFPVFSMFLALLSAPEPPVKEEADIVPAAMLPKGFLPRCVLFVFVFATAIGFIKGMWIASTPAAGASTHETSAVFVTLLATAALVVVFALASGMRRFDLSRIYYPIIIVTALAFVLVPLLGAEFAWLQAIVVGVAYNIFILTLWCLFANIAGQTDLGAVRVFGLGRGASAFGTTFGRFFAVLVVVAAPQLKDSVGEVGIVAAIIILVMAMFIFDEKTLGEALDKTFQEAAAPAIAGAGGEREALDPEEAWNLNCARFGESCGLTAREAEVLALFARGRTARYISEDLGISYNTAKGHVRKLYEKCGVHSRQELIDSLDASGEEPRPRA